MRDARAESGEGTKEPPPGLFDRLRADPVRAPELIALTASEWHAPAAAAGAGKGRRGYGEDGKTLGRMAKARHAQLARLEGAATGWGGFITLVPDLVGLAWIQSRLLVFVSAPLRFRPPAPQAACRAARAHRPLPRSGVRARGARRDGHADGRRVR